MLLTFRSILKKAWSNTPWWHAGRLVRLRGLLSHGLITGKERCSGCGSVLDTTDRCDARISVQGNRRGSPAG